VRARNAGEISQMEVLGYLFIGAIGGHETTAKTIGNTMYQLWRNPSQRKILLDDMDLMASCIDETVRFDGPVHLLCRTTSQEVEMHGVLIPEGSKVALLYISGNRDHRKYEDAESYLVARKCRDHLGFGGGIHACQGSALGRLQSRVVVEEILRAIPDYEVMEQGLARMHSPSVRGFTNVPVTF
jgi:cytochrome P450